MVTLVATAVTAALLVFGVTPLAAQAVGTGSISGVVSGPLTPGGAPVPLHNASVSISTVTGGIIPGSDTFPTYAITDRDGRYTIAGIPAGTYAMSVFSYGYKEQLLGGGLDFEASTKVTVEDGAQTSGVNSVLTLNVDSITGHLTGKSANGGPDVPMAYTSATLYRRDSVTALLQPVAGAATDGSGLYTIQNVPTGTYFLQFYAPNNQYLGAWYGSNPSLPNGAPITVTDGVLVSGINQVLELSGLSNMGGVSGTITGVTQTGATPVPVEGARVELYTIDGATLVYSATTNSSGAYSFTDIASGTYKLHVANTGSFFGEWWYDHPTAADAGSITFGPGQTASGTDLELSQLADDHRILVDDFLPAVEGTPTVGSTLTAWTAGWRPEAATTSLQWLRNGLPIEGATADTYIVKTTDAGASIAVSATGSRAGYRPTTVASPEVIVPASALTSVAPIITGTSQVGQRLSAAAGVWGPAPVKFAYQWKSNGVAISGAIWPSYVVGSAHVGKAITVTVTGTKTGFASVAVTSAPTAAVVKGTLSSSVPTVAGTVKVGQTLTATAGVWAPAAVRLTYKWTANGVTIVGATSSTFTLTGAQLGKKIVVKVTGTKAGYTTVTRMSAATAAVVR